MLNHFECISVLPQGHSNMVVVIVWFWSILSMIMCSFLFCAGIFKCNSNVVALHDQTIFCVEQPVDSKDRTKIQAMNFQVKSIYSFAVAFVLVFAKAKQAKNPNIYHDCININLFISSRKQASHALYALELSRFVILLQCCTLLFSSKRKWFAAGLCVSVCNSQLFNLLLRHMMFLSKMLHSEYT